MRITEEQGRTLRYLVVEPDGFQPDTRYPMVVLLHGFGSNMQDLAGLCPAIGGDGYLFALPNAPMAIQTGYGSVGYAWHPPDESDGGEQAERSAELLAGFFEEVLDEYRVAAGEAVLGGFSQGGMMTYRCGLTSPDLFRGLAALSAKVLGPDSLRTRLPVSRAQRVFISHGTADTMISVEDGRESRRLLETWGYKTDYREYEMGHEINQDVLADLVHWLREVLPPAAPRTQAL